MAQYSNLKAYIEEKIYENGTQAITGDILQDVLKVMTDDLGEFYQMGGVASPSTDPGTPDAKVIYIATEAGTYTNFGGITLAAGEVALLIFETSWTKETLNVLSSANGGVKTANLADGAVTTEKIAGGAVETAKIANNAVTSGKVADGAIGTAKIADGAIDADKIAANAVESAKIKNGAVTEGKINDGAVTAGKVAANAVTTAKIADDAVTTAKLNDGAVTEDKIATDAVTSGKVKDGAIGTAKIAAGAVTHAKIGAGAVEESNIKDGAVTSDKIANGAVGSDQLAEGAFSAENLADGSVTTDKLADGAVTAEKIADGAVTADKFANGSVTTIKLGSGAVTTEKIGDGMVTRQKLADSSVGTSKIIDGAVTTDKVADGAITDAKLENPVSVSQNTLSIGGEGVGELAGQLIENPEWAKVVTDSEDKILYGVKTDGKFYFGDGCPPQVQEYVQNIIEELSLDEYEDIVAFLNDYLGSDTTLKVMIDSINTQLNNKLDAEGLDSDALETAQAVENPEFIQATTDSENKILEGITTEGVKHINLPIDTPSATVEHIESPEWIEVKTDKDGRIIEGITTEGKKKIIVDTVFGGNVETLNAIFDSVKNTNADTYISDNSVELPVMSSNVEVKFTTGSSIYKQQEAKTLFKVGNLIIINVTPVSEDETMEETEAYFCDKCWADVNVTVNGTTQTILMRLQNFGYDLFSIRLKYPDLIVNLDGTTEVTAYLPQELENLYIKKTSTTISIHYADDSIYRSWNLGDYANVDAFVEALKADSTFTDVFEIVKYTCEDVAFSDIENFDKVHLCREMDEIKYRQGDGTPTYTGKTYWDAYPMFFRTTDVGYEHRMKVNYRVINGKVDKVYFSLDGLYLIFNSVNGSTSDMLLQLGDNSIVNSINKVSILPYSPVKLSVIAKQHEINVSETLLINAGNTTSTMHEFSILSYFRKKGFSFQNFDECISTIRGCNAINNSTLCIMFDDYQIGNWTDDTIRNMLHEFRVRPTLSYLFKATELDNENPPANAPTTEQYKEMKESHWDLQSHGYCMYMQQLTYAQFKQGFEKLKAAWKRWYGEDVCSYNGHGSHLTQWQYYLLKHMGFHTITGSAPHIGWFCEPGTTIDIQYKRISWINGDGSRMSSIRNYIDDLCD